MVKKNKYINKFKLNKKLCIVVGGSGLIGNEISKALVQVGATVINLDIEKNPKQKSKKIKYINFDCKNYSNFSDELNKIKKKYKFPDIFINASYPTSKDWRQNSFEKIKIESFQQNIDLHLNSYVMMAKQFADLLKKSGKSGAIIQLSSIYGVVAQNMNIYKNTKAKNNMTYPVIKGGINAFTKQMASYYGKYNIRVNSICPGGILGKYKGSNISSDKKFIRNYKNQNPLKRFCTVEDIASAAIFLSSDSSSYITGINLIVDGGWTSI